MIIGNKIVIREQDTTHVKTSEIIKYLNVLSEPTKSLGINLIYNEISAETGQNINSDNILEPLGKEILKMMPDDS